MTDATAGQSPASPLLRWLGIRQEELPAVAWSFTYFFSLLAGYYMLRSVRETMAIVSGVQNIPSLWTGTFFMTLLATPVFGWLTSRFPRRSFLPWVYYFFIANIGLFYVAFSSLPQDSPSLVWVARAFFVWLSVFNLFVVSVFWSFMADIYQKEQSRRLFGRGSIGAAVVPTVENLGGHSNSAPSLAKLQSSGEYKNVNTLFCHMACWLHWHVHCNSECGAQWEPQ